MKTGTITPAILTMLIGTVTATETFSIGADWIAVLAIILVAYGAVIYAHAFDR